MKSSNLIVFFRSLPENGVFAKHRVLRSKLRLSCRSNSRYDCCIDAERMLQEYLEKRAVGVSAESPDQHEMRV